MKGLLRDYFTHEQLEIINDIPIGFPINNIISLRASQNYCMRHLTSRRSDGGLTMQMSCLKDKPNMWAGPRWDTPEVVDRDSVLLCTGDVNHTVSCTRPNKIVTKGVGVQHLGVAGRGAWPKTGELRTFDIMYTRWFLNNSCSCRDTCKDWTTAALIGIPANVWRRPLGRPLGTHQVPI